MKPSLHRLPRRLAWLLLLAGIALHLTVRDGIDRLAIVFYVLALPVLFLLACLLAVKQKCARVLALGLFVWWSVHSWCWHAKPPLTPRLPGEVRVLFWNLNRPDVPSERLKELVKGFDPDVIGCTEPSRKGRLPVMADWQALLPAYRAGPGINELMWFTRGTPLTEKTARLAGLGSFAEVQFSFQNKVLRVGFVDVWADPRLPRTAQLNDAFAHVGNDQDAIVIGDFNTPADSVHFNAWREAGFQDSFKEAGRGWRETWFYGLPVLSIDHVWAGRDWKVIDCQKKWSITSDHAALLVRMVPR